MSERETREIKTPTDGYIVVIKTYLTGREYREIENVFLMQTKMNTPGQVETNIDGSVIKKAEDKLIEQAVISVNGETKNILNIILDFKNQDFSFVIKTLNEMKYGNIEDKKKPQ